MKQPVCKSHTKKRRPRDCEQMILLAAAAGQDPPYIFYAGVGEGTADRILFTLILFTLKASQQPGQLTQKAPLSNRFRKHTPAFSSPAIRL